MHSTGGDIKGRAVHQTHAALESRQHRQGLIPFGLDAKDRGALFGIETTTTASYRELAPNWRPGFIGPKYKQWLYTE